MPIVRTRIDVKPADAQFRHGDEIREENREVLDTDQTEMLNYVNWVLSYPGVLDRRAYAKDEHTWVTIIVFEDMAAHDKFEEANKDHPTVLKRIAYGKSIGITSTITVEDHPAE